ncbi:MAG: 3'(2'),5'-bisphosphate nucleotidase CysQ [Thermodesulfobacteriota bacterium]|nr:3'(2'),5'-bisphosphate nucleotidase CysQ [Thermodesulfobacteriota bacterium]
MSGLVDLEALEALVRSAGDAILEVYRGTFDVEHKEDRSPLTVADTRSHRILADGLKALTPGIPVLSEEGKHVAYAHRRHWERFWLVDPLDGTKEFIKRNGEFTINVALVEGRLPILGIIHVPVADLFAVGDVHRGGEIRGPDGSRPLAIVKDPPAEGVRVVRSRSHASPDLERLLEALPGHRVVSKGSALKFIALAAGEADFYPRTGATWEWDTAAGQALVTAAGGVVVDFHGNPLTYNKPDLLNGPFLAAPSLKWLEATGILARAARLSLHSAHTDPSG